MHHCKTIGMHWRGTAGPGKIPNGAKTCKSGNPISEDVNGPQLSIGGTNVCTIAKWWECIGRAGLGRAGLGRAGQAKVPNGPKLFPKRSQNGSRKGSKTGA